MNKRESNFCWTYNLFNPTKFKEILNEEEVSLIIDVEDGKLSDRMEKMLLNRKESLAISPEKFFMNFNEDVMSYNLLRLIASVSEQGRRWFITKETELFVHRINTINSNKMAFINDIFGKKTVKNTTTSDIDGEGYFSRKPWKDIDGVINPFDPNETLKIRWNHFTHLIKKRGFTVKDGWIYTTWNDVFGIMKKKFKIQLENRMKVDQKNVLKNEELHEILEEYATVIDGMLPKRENVELESTEIDYIIALSPLCMRVMDRRLQLGDSLGHEANLILSFFLKKFLSIEELQEYFYSRNPVNQKEFSSVDDYMRNIEHLDYIFKFMYGKVGIGKNYNPHGCKKIQEKMECPFLKQDIDKELEIMNKELIEPIDDTGKRSLMRKFKRMSRSRQGNRACGTEFMLRMGFDTSTKKNVFHPIFGYFEHALKIAKERKNKSS